MTVPTTPAPSRNSSHHRHSKSGSAIIPPASQPKSQPHHTAHQIQSSPPRGLAAATSNMPKTPGASSKSKRRRQRRPKDVKTSSPDQSNAPASAPRSSPDRLVNEHTTTPTESVSTPSKAYAGPMFHHSPAPSSLPVPKFFSKSVPSRKAPGLQAMMEEDDSATDASQSPSPTLDNPLERLFRADREEKARKNRQAAGDSSDSDSAPDMFGRDIFSMDPDSPVRPAFNTPRTSTARPAVDRSVTEPMFSMDALNASLPSSPVQAVPRKHDETERQAKSAALRQLLFQQPGVSSSPVHSYSMTTVSPSPSPAHRNRIVVSPQGSPLPHRYQARSAPITTNVGKPPPPKLPPFHSPQQHRQPRSPVHDGRYNQQFSNIFDTKGAGMPCTTESRDFTDMENGLRRILKLEPRPSMTGGVMI